jgi:hypothetical protein
MSRGGLWQAREAHLSMKVRFGRQFAWPASSPWIPGCLAAVLAACAHIDTQPQAAGKVTPQMRSGSSELRSYQLVDWVAPDDRTLIVNSVDRSLFEARFKRQCTGLRLVDTIAFIVPTPPQIEKYQGVVLPNGTRCAFASMTRVDTAPAHPKETAAPADDL